MANFKDSPIFSTHNDYYTPKYAWEQIQHFVSKDKVVYEAFMLNSNEQSKKYLQELGYNVVGDKTIDFLTNDLRKDNLKYKCIKKLLDIDKPFIILINSTNTFQKWYKELVQGKDIKFIFTSKKINYDKYEEGGIKKIEQKKNACSFNATYMTYKVLDKNEWI